ncbi:MAG: pyridoxamine 5'-phosphate oxidase family protein [Fusobacteriaceae bacterium]|nr:pyridoxamine 5'-phosphate oxidase family protein [Fusobacteriaceae bacterium]
MKRALNFLKEAGTFYLATVENDQPRVRPFGAVFEHEGKLYTVSNNTKKCFDQMMKNPKIEISGMNQKGEWIRITGEIANDERKEVKELALELIPSLKRMYSVDDGIFATLYFTKGNVIISSFNKEPETFDLY